MCIVECLTWSRPTTICMPTYIVYIAIYAWIISYAFTPKAQMNMRAYAAAVEQSHILSHSRCTYFYIG